jgi:chemotaxis protein MotB
VSRHSSSGRRRKSAAPENHERWLISYADFITLLFAFFVVMFASSQADRGRAQEMSESVKKALEGGKMASLISVVLGGTVEDTGQGSTKMHGPAIDLKPNEEKKDTKLAELLPSLQVLKVELQDEIKAGQIQLNMQQRGLVISFTQASLFPSGEDVIAPGAHSGLERVAAAIAKIPNPVRLEGHTDSVPIKTPRFRSNWDLSAARSIALLELLSTQFGIPKERLSIAGYADTAPVASNDTEEGRSKNRRVDLVILNEQGVMAEPRKIEQPADPKQDQPQNSRDGRPSR